MTAAAGRGDGSSPGMTAAAGRGDGGGAVTGRSVMAAHQMAGDGQSASSGGLPDAAGGVGATRPTPTDTESDSGRRQGNTHRTTSAACVVEVDRVGGVVCVGGGWPVDRVNFSLSLSLSACREVVWSSSRSCETRDCETRRWYWLGDRVCVCPVHWWNSGNVCYSTRLIRSTRCTFSDCTCATSVTHRSRQDEITENGNGIASRMG